MNYSSIPSQMGFWQGYVIQKSALGKINIVWLNKNDIIIDNRARAFDMVMWKVIVLWLCFIAIG